MKKIIIIFFLLLLAVLGFVFGHIPSQKPKTAEINGHKFQLELAVSEEERERGLSGRENLCRECAMLFVFPQKGMYNFWMKGMRFDLDIIWISDGRIVNLAEKISHENKETINPEKMADYVLEINSGLAEEYNFQAGDRVDIFQ